MKHSYILAGATTGKLLKLIFRNGVSLHPVTILRFLFLLQNGIWSSFFKRRERLRFGDKLANAPVPKDPIIIIGHWRTGSTLLHQLFSLDKNFTTPTVFQVSLPDSLLVSEKYYRPVMTSMMNKTRPMDNVKLGFDEPQEDEYALLKLTADSPLEQVIFHNPDNYFLKNYYDFKPENLETWKKSITQYCTKLSFGNKKQIVLKNPFHSLRIDLLREIFPEAKFIHIHRHPYSVVPSTINMWNIIATQNRLNGKWKNPSVEEVTDVLNNMLYSIRKSLSNMPEGTFCEINFEKIEIDPVAAIKEIYKQTGLNFTGEYESSVKEYLLSLKNYRKNIFALSNSDKEIIKYIMADHFIHYQYPHE